MYSAQQRREARRFSQHATYVEAISSSMLFKLTPSPLSSSSIAATVSAFGPYISKGTALSRAIRISNMRAASDDRPMSPRT
jgi:hypothetical protein